MIFHRKFNYQDGRRILLNEHSLQKIYAILLISPPNNLGYLYR